MGIKIIQMNHVRRATLTYYTLVLGLLPRWSSHVRPFVPCTLDFCQLVHCLFVSLGYRGSVGKQKLYKNSYLLLAYTTS